MADFRGYMIGSFASSRLDRGGIPVVATTGKVSDASAAEPTVDFGINPCQWNSLPPEGILLWKVRHPVTETEASYPATIVLPSGLSTTTPVTVSNAFLAPAFVRYLAVRCFVGDTIKWSEMI